MDGRGKSTISAEEAAELKRDLGQVKNMLGKLEKNLPVEEVKSESNILVDAVYAGKHIGRHIGRALGRIPGVVHHYGTLERTITAHNREMNERLREIKENAERAARDEIKRHMQTTEGLQ